MKSKLPLLIGLPFLIVLAAWFYTQSSGEADPIDMASVNAPSAAGQTPETGADPVTPVEADGEPSEMSVVKKSVLTTAEEPSLDLVASVPSATLREKIAELAPSAQREAVRRLGELSIPEQDFASLGVTGDGRFYYLNDIVPHDHGAHDHHHHDHDESESLAPEAAVGEAAALSPANTAAAAVPVASPPVRHSRPGSANVLYLDFNGHTITGTSWNSGSGRQPTYIGRVYDIDDDPTTFSDEEQADIIEIWERVAEDFSPFDVNVTTEEPNTFTSTTGRALITENVDANGHAMPSATAGGVAQLGVFGESDYATRGSPAFVYFNNFSGSEANIAEAVTHELGHNMGLTHDGELGDPGREYHNGQGSGDTSWAPIMGVAYGKNVSQWSKGEYTDANNQQDDIAIMAGLMGFLTDEAGGTTATAAAASLTGSEISDQGVISSSADVDLFSFSTATGSVSLAVNTFRYPDDTHGGNADVKLELLDSSGAVVATHAPTDSTNAALTYAATAGTYFARLTADGSANYTSYGSAGQYTLTGTIIAAAPTITSATTASVAAGAEFSFAIVGTNGPTAYTATGLPAGLSVDTATGVISGRATVVGEFVVALTATNSLGTANANLTLTVTDSVPVITAQTGSRVTLAPGDSTSLSATVISANGSPTYQWQHNGRDISGATGSTLNLNSVTRSAQGYYRVRVTNSVGTTDGDTVFVIVSPTVTQVLVWGLNEDGQTSVPADLGATSQISMGFEYVVALLRDGTLRAWGSDSSGQATIPTGLTDVVQVATGSFHALALQADGSVVGWGNDFYDQASPPDGLEDVVYIAAGGSSSLAVKSDGSVVAWGENDNGQTDIPDGLTDVIAAEIGTNHVLALKSDGSVVAWGLNTHGQTTVDAGATSTDMVAAGYEYSIARQSDGSVFSWGRNQFGQRTLPNGLTTFSEIATGWYQTIGLKADGTVAVWGINSDGQLDAPDGLGQVFNVDADRYNSVALRDASGDVPPTISTQPVTQSVVEGTDVSFTVVASGGTSLLSYQWRKGGVNIDGATSSTLSLPNASISASGDYDVVVTNQLGSVTSNSATLTVAAIPVISAQSPARVLIDRGERLALSVTATGTGDLSYQWHRNGVAIDGATSSTYSEPGFGAADAGVYYVTITDSVGTRRSQLMFAQYAPAESEVFAWGTNGDGQTSVPADLDDAIVVAPGRTHALALKRDGTVVAWGSNFSQERNVPGDLTDVVQIAAGYRVSYALKSDGTVVEWGSANFTHTGLPEGLADVISIAYYGFHGLALKADGSVVGWGENGDGETTIPSGMGQVIQIDVGGATSYALNSEGQLFAWGYSENDETAVPAASALWKDVTGGGFHAVGLKSDGTAEGWGFSPYADPPAGLTGLVAVSAGRQHVLGLSESGLITPWGRNDNGETDIPTGLDSVFSVAAGHNFSLAIKEIRTPTAPAITTQPQTQIVNAGASVSFTVAASGYPAPTFQWRKAGVDIDGATGSTFTIDPAALADTGSYDVVVTNDSGSATSDPATLTVNQAPAITTHPGSRTVVVGTPVTLTVAATGVPAPTYQWRKNGSNISGATSASLVFGGVLLADAADYDVVVTNSLGSVTSNIATITVQKAPEVTDQPQSQTVLVGAEVTLSVTATGTPAPTYQWRKNGVDIVGATTDSFTLAAADLGDAGDYDVVVTNSVSSATSAAATLTINQAPAITTQPESATVVVGTPVTLTVAATGSPAPTYQWRKNEVDIDGARGASLIFGAVVLSDAADYDVVVTNLVGSVTSMVATLTTRKGPEITTQPVSQTVHVGTSVAFTVEATGTPAPSFQWRKDGQNIGGATSASLGLSDVGLEDSGAYSVAVSNDVETVVSDAANLAIISLSGSHETNGYRVGQTITVNNTVTYTGSLTQLVWSVVPPYAVGGQDWSLSASAGTAADNSPTTGTTELLEWTWNTVPASPFTFSYDLNVPAAAAGDYSLTGMLESTSAAGTLQVMATPDPLVLSEAAAFHSADTDSDFRINLSELLRVIELYNTRSGTSRTGGYRVDPSTDDGFAPDPVGTASSFHSADTDRDSRINLSELLRVIELYNTRSGTSRTGAYRIDISTTDGFAPDV